MNQPARLEEETPLEFAERVLHRTAKHPDAPSAPPMYLRAMLEIAVAQERRDLEDQDDETRPLGPLPDSDF